jgi:hypothetical protein
MSKTYRHHRRQHRPKGLFLSFWNLHKLSSHLLFGRPMSASHRFVKSKFVELLGTSLFVQWGRPTRTKSVNVKTQPAKSGHEPKKGIDTKTDWLTDRQSQRDLDLEPGCQYLDVGSCPGLRHPGSEGSTAVEKATSLGDRQPKITVSGPPGWGFCGKLVKLPPPPR